MCVAFLHGPFTDCCARLEDEIKLSPANQLANDSGGAGSIFRAKYSCLRWTEETNVDLKWQKGSPCLICPNNSKIEPVINVGV